MAHPQLQARGGRVPDMSAATLFTEVLPRLCAVRRPMLQRLGGTYGFKVLDVGEWVLDFAAATVCAADASKAELQITIGADELKRLMNGTLDVQGAQAQGRFEIAGERALLANLTAALRPDVLAPSMMGTQK